MNHLDESSQSRQQQIFTVTRLNSAVRMILEQDLGLVWLTGELSNLAMPSSGHWYFSLKDISAQVRCAMFKGNNRRVPFRPQDGMQVLVQARVSLYEPRGDYQLIIESMQPAGDGMLALRFEELKRRLGAEGLYDEGRKRPLPREPRAVGLVTSATGAALHDMLTVLERRAPESAGLHLPDPGAGQRRHRPDSRGHHSCQPPRRGGCAHRRSRRRLP